jgi:hypothetical protein
MVTILVTLFNSSTCVTSSREMQVSCIFGTNFECYKVKYFASEEVAMVIIPVTLFSSSSCVLVAYIFIVWLHCVHTCDQR